MEGIQQQSRVGCCLGVDIHRPLQRESAFSFSGIEHHLPLPSWGATIAAFIKQFLHSESIGGVWSRGMLESIDLWLFFLFNYVLLLKLQNQKLFHPSSLIMDRAYPSKIVHVNEREMGAANQNRHVFILWGG